MRLLELFCGSKSIGKVFEKNGFEVVSLDIDPKFHPTICCDILDFDYRKYQPGSFDVLWSSPPCQMFSSLRWCLSGRTKKKGITKEQLQNDLINLGLPPLLKTLEIIKYLKPKIWFIENPQTGLMKDYLDLPYSDCAYCQYNMEYKKPTRIWNNMNLQLEKCKCKQKHSWTIGKLGTQKYRTEQLYVIPEKLCESIYSQVINYLTHFNKSPNLSPELTPYNTELGVIDQLP